MINITDSFTINFEPRELLCIPFNTPYLVYMKPLNSVYNSAILLNVNTSKTKKLIDFYYTPRLMPVVNGFVYISPPIGGMVLYDLNSYRPHTLTSDIVHVNLIAPTVQKDYIWVINEQGTKGHVVNIITKKEEAIFDISHYDDINFNGIAAVDSSYALEVSLDQKQIYKLQYDNRSSLYTTTNRIKDIIVLNYYAYTLEFDDTNLHVFKIKLDDGSSTPVKTFQLKGTDFKMILFGNNQFLIKGAEYGILNLSSLVFEKVDLNNYKNIVSLNPFYSTIGG